MKKKFDIHKIENKSEGALEQCRNLAHSINGNNKNKMYQFLCALLSIRSSSSVLHIQWKQQRENKISRAEVSRVCFFFAT